MAGSMFLLYTCILCLIFFACLYVLHSLRTHFIYETSYLVTKVTLCGTTTDDKYAVTDILLYTFNVDFVFLLFYPFHSFYVQIFYIVKRGRSCLVGDDFQMRIDCVSVGAYWFTIHAQNVYNSLLHSTIRMIANNRR